MYFSRRGLSKLYTLLKEKDWEIWARLTLRSFTCCFYMQIVIHQLNLPIVLDLGLYEVKIFDVHLGF